MHACVTGWQELFLSYKCLQLSAAIAITTFEKYVYGWKFSGYLILSLLQLALTKFFKSEPFSCLIVKVDHMITVMQGACYQGLVPLWSDFCFNRFLPLPLKLLFGKKNFSDTVKSQKQRSLMTFNCSSFFMLLNFHSLWIHLLLIIFFGSLSHKTFPIGREWWEAAVLAAGYYF